MLWKLLKTNINSLQITAYAIGSLIGLIIIGAGIQFYRDTRPSSPGRDDPFSPDEYMVVARQTRTSLFGGNRTEGLTQTDIDDIAALPWAADAAPFLPAGFDVTVSLDFAGRGFSTALFLEGIPERFLDTAAPPFDPARPEVAIILPTDYLALYNFGFAPARGLPVLDERMIKMAPLKVTISGNGRSMTLPGRIAAFSSRINTIAVSDEFIRWADAQLSTAGTAAVNRAIIKISDPGNPDIARYLRDHSLEESASDESTSRTRYILRIVTAAVTVTGLLISLLALGMLLLSISLLLQKNRRTIADLLLLGYSPGQVARPYLRLIGAVNAAVAVAACAALCAIIGVWHTTLSESGIAQTAVWPTLLIIIAVMAAVTAVGAIIITRRIRSLM